MTPKPIAAALIALGLATVGTAFAEDRMTHDAYKAEKDRIEADYKAAKEACKKLSGNAEDVCKAQAKADYRIAEADLDREEQGYRQGACRRPHRPRGSAVRRREGEMRRPRRQREGRVREGCEGRGAEGEGRREGRAGRRTQRDALTGDVGALAADRR